MIYHTGFKVFSPNQGSGQEEEICVGTVKREAISQVLYDQDVRNTLFALGVMEKETHSEISVLCLKRCARHIR
jgi:hypothetical protein